MRVGGGDGSATDGAVAWEHVDRADRRSPRFEVVLGPGDWVEYRVEVTAEARLEVEVGLGPGGPEASGASLRIDGAAVSARLDGGRLAGTTDGAIAAGQHAVRVEGRGPETVIRWVAARLHVAHDGPMTYDLERFVAVQDRVYADVIRELRRGRKESHWMWFVFPQVAGLGYSAMSQRYAIASLDEARAYLAHPVLGARLRECAALLLASGGRTAEQVFGSIDAMKLRSSMTLFGRAAPDEPLFAQVLDRFFDGTADAATDALLA
jgi:uncharacterized protein (DUF1810 family)